MSLHLTPPDSRGGRQFRMDQVDAEKGQRVATQTGNGYEFWWVHCCACDERFGAVIHVDAPSAACPHCDWLLAISFDARREGRRHRAGKD